MFTCPTLAHPCPVHFELCLLTVTLICHVTEYLWRPLCHVGSRLLPTLLCDEHEARVTGARGLSVWCRYLFCPPFWGCIIVLRADPSKKSMDFMLGGCNLPKLHNNF